MCSAASCVSATVFPLINFFSNAKGHDAKESLFLQSNHCNVSSVIHDSCGSVNELKVLLYNN